MNSNFLNSLGIGNWDMGLVLFIVAILLFITLVALFVVLSQFNKLKRRFDRFTAGRNARSLEDEIANIFEDNKALRELSEKNRKDIRVIYHNLESTYQKASLVRYDAFPQMGGKLSFSLALLNEKNNGFIINSVHGTDGCYTYSKKVTSGICDISLGAEEQQALNEAMNQ